MSLVPVLHPEIKRPLVFGWQADVPLPSLTTDAFDVHPLYPRGVLQIVIGPNMDPAAEAALQLVLSSAFVSNVECVSVVFHAVSFTEDRLCRVEQYISLAAVKEVRVLDPSRQYESTTIGVSYNGQISQMWILVIAADDINDHLGLDLAASPASISLKILPPRSAETFKKDYHSFFNRLLNVLQCTAQLQRLILPLDFMSRNPREVEIIFDLLQRQPYLEELQLHLSTVFGVDEDESRGNLLRETIHSKARFLRNLRSLNVPAHFIRDRIFPPTGSSYSSRNRR